MGRIALAMTLAAVLALPAAAQGTVTIGSNLGRAPNSCLTGSVSFVQLEIPAGNAATGGLSSPVSGAVTAGRIRAGGLTGPVAFQVIRPFEGVAGVFTGAGTSAQINPAPAAVSVHPLQLPISIGDRIGVTYEAPGMTCPTVLVGPAPAGSKGGSWQPALADGGPGRAPTPGDVELTINADIEPSSAFTISKLKPGKRGNVTVTASLPNPGILSAGDVRDATLAAAAKKKRKKPKKLLKSATTAASAPGQASLLVRATKAARSLLREKGKLKAKLKVVFTPTGGSPSTQVLKVKLRR